MSVIATVLNEYGSLPRWLQALERQRFLPDEFIVIDGGSTDGTWELLQGWRPPVPVIVERLPGSTISEARNVAISRASGEIIAITDAGTVADPGWLSHLCSAFEDPGVDVAGGFFVPLTEGRWSTALAATTLPTRSEIDGDSFLPSSRSVAVKARWLQAGFCYPEWLDYCEDLVFDLKLKRAGARFAFVPDAVVQFEPRKSPRAFFRQYYRYARGDGKAGLFARRHLIRYGTYAGLAAALWRRRPAELAACTLLGALYMRRPVQRLVESGRYRGRTLAVLVLVAIAQRLLGDLAKMCGYPAGLRWRWRRYGALGPRTSWRRISYRGSLWRPPPASTGTQRPRASRDDESPRIVK